MINPETITWCLWPSRWALCDKASALANEALGTAEYVAETYGLTDHNGKADALRHCVWSGWMTRDMGADTAQGFTDRHELGEAGEPQDEFNMDMTNNGIGRQVGQGPDSIYNTCLADAANGVLVSLQT